jgi:tape measure domain-containing protein
MADLNVAIALSGTDSASRPIDNVSNALNGLRGSAESGGNAVSGLFSTLASGVGLAAGMALLNGITAAIQAVGDAAVGLNSGLEQSSIAFTTMLGSGQKAQDFLTELQKFAAATPFQFPELVQASQKMLAFGFAAKDVIPLLTAVGNTAAALGSGHEGIDRITLALGQMQAKTKVSGDEMLQLTEAGVAAWDILAKALGTDVADAMKRVQDRTVDASVFIKAFEENAASKFGDMMEKQSHTLAGAWSTIQDSVQMVIAEGFKPLYTILAQGADQVAQFVQSAAFDTWGKRAATVFQGVANGLKAALVQMTGFWQGHLRDLQGIGTALQHTIGDAFGSLGRTLQGLVGGAFAMFLPLMMAGVQPAIRWVQQNWPLVLVTVGNVIRGIGQTLGAVLPPFVFMARDLFATFLGFVQREFPVVQAIFQTVFGNAQQIATSATAQIVSVLTGSLGGVVAWVEARWPVIEGSIRSVLLAVLNVAQQVLPQVGGLIQGTLGTAATTLQRNWDIVVQALDLGLKATLGTLGELAPVVSQVIVAAFSRFTQWVVQNWPTVTSTIDNSATLIRQVLQGLSDFVTARTAIIKDVLFAMLAAIQGDTDRAGTILQATWQRVWSGIQSTAQTIWTAISAAVGALWTGLVGLADERFPAITATIRSAWNTVQQITTTVWGALQETVRGGTEIIGRLIVAWQAQQAGDWQGAKDTLGRVWEQLWQGIQIVAGTVTQAVGALVTQAWDALVAAARARWPQVVSAIQTAWDTVTQITTTTWGALQETVRGGQEIIQRLTVAWQAQQAGDFQGARDTLGRVWEQLWQGIQIVATTVSGAVGTLIGQAWDALVALADQHFPHLTTIVRTAFEAIQTAWTTVLQPALQAVQAKVTEIKDWIGANWHLVPETISTAFTTIQSAWTSTLQPALQAVLDKFGAVKDWAVEHWPDVQHAAETAWKAIQTAWTTTLEPALTDLLAKFTAVKDWAVAHWPDVQHAVESAWTGIQNLWATVLFPALRDLGDKFESLRADAVAKFPMVASAAEGAFNRITQAAPLPQQWFDYIKNSVMALNDRLNEQGAYTNLRQSWDILAGDVGPRLSQIVQAVTDKFRDLGGGGAGGQNSVLDTVAFVITKTTESIKVMVTGLAVGLQTLQSFGSAAGVLAGIVAKLGQALDQALRGHDFQGALQTAQQALGMAGQLQNVGADWFDQTQGIVNRAFGGPGTTGLPFGGTGQPGSPNQPNPFQPPPPPPIQVPPPPTNPIPPFNPQQPGGWPSNLPDTEISRYIVQDAQGLGFKDPFTAVRVALTEGGVTEPARMGAFDTGRSFWPFQLHYGGAGTPYAAWGTVAGMGNEFTQLTGWGPGDPNAWKASTDFALQRAAQVGWGPWYGAASVGITGFQGIKYGGGGMAMYPQLALVGETGPERILNPEETRAYDGQPIIHKTYNINVTGSTAMTEADFRAMLRRIEFSYG